MTATDPVMDRIAAAHYVADLQEWDLRAAERLTDERAEAHHASLSVRGFFPSLHLNLAADHAELGDRAAAREHPDAAGAALPDLPEDGYGEGIRAGIARLSTELGSG